MVGCGRHKNGFGVRSGRSRNSRGNITLAERHRDGDEVVAYRVTFPDETPIQPFARLPGRDQRDS